MTYSAHFAGEEDAGRYDAEQYAPDSYSTLLWRIEKRQLGEILDRHAPPHFDYLDFACGTGRVLAEVAPHAGTSVGIDVSDAMASRARERVPDVRVLARDITAGGPVEGQYDVITAFRFLLNAEPRLRRDGLRALRARLRDSSSVLIINNHGNLNSHKAVMALPHWVRNCGRRQQSGNVLSHRAVVRLAEQSGLEIQRVGGCGFLGGRVGEFLPRKLSERVEGWIAASPLRFFTSNQLYVAQLRKNN